MKSLREFVATNPLMVVAHRGSSGTAPENTLASLKRAVKAGVQMVEIDVQLTSDNEIVVFHDATLERTTNGRGNIGNFTSRELRKLDAGSWFAKEFTGERIPLLSEALQLLRDKVYVNIEIKPPQPHENYVTRIDKITSIARNADLVPYTLFSSFHHKSLEYLKSLSPEFHAAAIQTPGDDRLPSVIVRKSDCDAFVCSLEDLTPERAENIHKHNIHVGVYTINTKEELNLALQRKANALVTNFPAAIINELRTAGMHV